MDPFFSKEKDYKQIDKNSNNYMQDEYNQAQEEYIQLHLGEKIRYYKGGEKMDINDQHYKPSFIAKDVEELRENPRTRKVLRKHNIFRGEQEDEKYKYNYKEYKRSISSDSEKEEERAQKKSTKKLQSRSSLTLDSSEETEIKIKKSQKREGKAPINIQGLSTPKKDIIAGEKEIELAPPLKPEGLLQPLSKKSS